VLLWLLISWWRPVWPARCRSLVPSRVHEHHGPHATHRLVRKPELAGPTSCHHFWALSEDKELRSWRTARDDNKLLILQLGARVAHRVTSASSVRFTNGCEVCLYRHVICVVASKSRVSRNCRAKEDDGPQPAPRDEGWDDGYAPIARRADGPGKEPAAVRDPVMLPVAVKDGDWTFGRHLVDQARVPARECSTSPPAR